MRAPLARATEKVKSCVGGPGPLDQSLASGKQNDRDKEARSGRKSQDYNYKGCRSDLGQKTVLSLSRLYLCKIFPISSPAIVWLFADTGNKGGHGKGSETSNSGSCEEDGR